MQGITRQLSGAFIAVLSLAGSVAADDAPASTAIVISVAEQKMALLRDGELLKKYPISTSKFGVGDGPGSYKTPLGKLRVCDKIGDELAIGAVLKKRHATGEVLPVNAPGRDPIVTRIIWLEGLEAQNDNARARGIYIHGTNEEKKIGQPVSYGCIRMRSKDVVEVFDELPMSASVSIIAEKLPRFAKYTPQKPQIIAAAVPTPVPAKSVSAAHKPTPTPMVETKLTLTKTEPQNLQDPAAKRALAKSILLAGLPDGPKIVTALDAPEPKDVSRFTPVPPAASPGPTVLLRDSAEASAPTEPSGRIAFRSGPSKKTQRTH